MKNAHHLAWIARKASKLYAKKKNKGRATWGACMKQAAEAYYAAKLKPYAPSPNMVKVETDWHSLNDAFAATSKDVAWMYKIAAEQGVALPFASHENARRRLTPLAVAEAVEAMQRKQQIVWF